MEGTSGKRVPFSILATTTPKLLLEAGSRQCAVFYTGATAVYLGVTGTAPSSGWMLVPANTVFHDLFSSDAWWAATAAGSGTLSGYAVI
jgi:hypothetical protein